MTEQIPLKMQLQQNGPLRTNAWESLCGSYTEHIRPASRTITLDAGDIIYIKQGLLKQCNGYMRTEPAVNRFLRGGQFLFVPYYTGHCYVRSIQRCTLYHWTEATIRQLLTHYPELLLIYRRLYNQFEQLLDVRLQIMERIGAAKVTLFDHYFPQLRPYIKQQDLANYLGMNKNYLSQIIREL